MPRYKAAYLDITLAGTAPLYSASKQAFCVHCLLKQSWERASLTGAGGKAHRRADNSCLKGWGFKGW